MKSGQGSALVVAAIASAVCAAPAFGQQASGAAGSTSGFAGENWSLKLSGRVLLDYNIVEADEADLDVSAGETRLIKLGAAGKYGDNLAYKLELATDSSGDVSANDAYLDFKFANGWAIRAGQMKTPNSLDEQTSEIFTSTLERAAFTDAFELDRRLGVMLHRNGRNYTFAAGVFGENLDATGADEGMAVAARGTYTPVNREAALVHLGASARYLDQGEDSGLVRYRQRPFAHIPGRVVSTGAIADSELLVALEAAAIRGPVWAAGEYGRVTADCPACSADPDFDGYYVEIGSFFGGRKTYKGGKFDRPKVDHPFTEGGPGALSIVVRFDAVNLRDSAVDGGKLDTTALGLDWWPTSHVRAGLDLFSGDARYGASTSGLDPAFAAQVLADASSDTVQGAVARLQFDF